MAQIQEQPETTPQESSEAPKIKYRIHPTHHLDYDCCGIDWSLEIHLPGVKSEDIDFKVLKESYILEARREVALYTLSGYFPFVADVKSVKGSYENGLLTIKGKVLDPLAEAVELKIE
jgi:HSP20 family molecular chaperone IbpA